MDDFDVAIVGYGPVGKVLALMLGQRGHRVLVLEQQLTSYPLPRAAHHDDEVGRILQGVGLAPSSMPAVTEPYDDFYELRNERHETLLRLDWRGRGPSGWNVSNFFHQPALESRIEELVDLTGNVDVRWGHRARAAEDGDLGVDIEVQDIAVPDAAAPDIAVPDATAGSTTDTYHVRAKYVIGADGANSVVRDWVGTDVVDLGYFHDWLVVDVVPDLPVTIDPPVVQSCDPRRPTTAVPSGPGGRRRWEFMRLPDEEPVGFSSEEHTWELLGAWGIDRSSAAIERQALYTFQASWARDWRRGRLLLAGDSAHLMPPFAGQGMCSGFRDAANLAWKLHLVLEGGPDDLLDTYGPERTAHVRELIALSMQLGEVICVSDPAEARRRDERMKQELRAGTKPPPPPSPRLGPGLHRGDLDDCAGTLSIQATVRGADGTGLFDDVTGSPGALIGTADVLGSVDDGRRAALLAVGVGVVAIADQPGPAAVVDVDGAYTDWLRHNGAQAVLVRPDHYLYGAVRTGESVPEMVDEFLSRLAVEPSPPS